MNPQQEKHGGPISHVPIDLVLRNTADQCPHCDAILEPVFHEDTGLNVPTCPECAIEFYSDEAPSDDHEITAPIEDEINRSC